MADDDESSDGGGGENSYLWILFFCLFLVLLAVSIYALFRGACSFWGRYCLCRRCCCVMDVEAYRRERESLRRLRELRHIHRMEQLNLRHRLAVANQGSQQHHHHASTPAVEFHPIPLATFSQIPGPIPHSYSSSGRVLTPAELQATTPHARVYENMNALGFILVPAGAPLHLDTARRGGTANANAFRDSLTPEQRRAVLERLLVFTNYHAAEETHTTPDATTTTELDSTTISERKSKGKEQQTLDLSPNDPEVGPPPPEVTAEPTTTIDEEAVAAATTTADEEGAGQTFAFPLHEEPEEIDKTCAICLDDFEEGELINDASKCPHVFHRDCLLSWLDRHSVCPCCRRPMITENDWQSARRSGAATTNRANDTATTTETNTELIAVTDGSSTT